MPAQRGGLPGPLRERAGPGPAPGAPAGELLRPRPPLGGGDVPAHQERQQLLLRRDRRGGGQRPGHPPLPGGGLPAAGGAGGFPGQPGYLRQLQRAVEPAEGAAAVSVARPHPRQSPDPARPGPLGPGGNGRPLPVRRGIEREAAGSPGGLFMHRSA